MNRLSELCDADYERFRDLILARTGMLFGPRQRDALARGLASAAERAGVPGLAPYYRALQAARTDAPLWDDLVGAITVGETYFFRNPAHLDALRARILPDLITRHQANRRLRIWSAGCSSGEEAYSLAILLHELLPDLADWRLSILATDINKDALRRASEGLFREWSFRQTDPAIRQRYFRARNGAFELDSQVRGLVTFAYLNLVEDSYPSLTTNTNALDLILCRNVAIYLPQSVIRQMAARFHNCLAPEGWLVVGAAETHQEVYSQFAT